MALPKLNKCLAKNIQSKGILELTREQEKMLTRIKGGASFYLIGENLTEQRNGLIIASLQYLNYSMPDTPRCVIIAPNHLAAESIYNTYLDFAQDMQLGIHLVTEEGKLDDQNMAIYAGADLVIGTIGQLLKLYFQCGINVNKVGLVVLLDIENLIFERKLQEIERLTDSFSKFQILIQCHELDEKIIKFGQKYFAHHDFLKFD